MTKPYHLTQEQAEAIAKDVESKSLTPLALVRIASTRELQAFANAALDKVLGEPVGETMEEGYRGAMYGAEIPNGTKLYAPRREK